MKSFWDQIDKVADDVGAPRSTVLLVSTALWVMIATFVARWYWSI